MGAWATYYLDPNSPTSTSTPISATSTVTVVWSQNTTATSLPSTKEEWVYKPKAPRFSIDEQFPRRKPKELGARHGFQQLARIPNYRGVRTR